MMISPEDMSVSFWTWEEKIVTYIDFEWSISRLGDNSEVRFSIKMIITKFLTGGIHRYFI